MSIKIPEVKVYKTFSKENIKQTFKPRHIISAMASEGFLPVIALEAFVEGGRTLQAYKRGGFDEARERITEEFMGAVFWLGGVTGLNWVFEKLGQRIFKLPKKVVNIESDSVRNPLNKYLSNEKRNGQPISKSFMAKFKFAKVISSVLIANAFIGFVLPKMNQAITRSRHKNNNLQNNNNNTYFDTFIAKPDITSFGNVKDKNPSFGMNLLTVANNFENNRNWRLLSVDAGTCSGRVYSARNNDERVEIAFRDLSSIYFYMFCMPHMNSFLNKLEHGHSTRLDPVSAQFATEYMNNYLDSLNTDKVSLSDFKKDFMGNANEFLTSEGELPESLRTKFKGSDKDIKTIDLEVFKSELKKIIPQNRIAQFENIADQMSQLQPQLVVPEEIKDSHGKVISTKYNKVSILTQDQAKDILTGGHINNPDFLKAFYRNHFGKKFDNEYKFVAQSEIEELKSDLTNFVQSIITRVEKSNGKEVTKDILKKASIHNLKMNAINWGAGFVVSAAFLSTFIPKLQYYITKMRTGQDAFPGTEEYRNAA